SIGLLPVDVSGRGTNEPSKKTITNLGAKVRVISREKRQYLEYIPGKEGFDKFKYVLTDPCALNKSEANVSVTVYCCDKPVEECKLPDLSVIITPEMKRTVIDLRKFETAKDVTITDVFPDKDNKIRIVSFTQKSITVEFIDEIEIVQITYKGNIGNRTNCTGTITFTVETTITTEITGKVTIQNEPLIDATIHAKDFTDNAVTDVKGDYRITVPVAAKTLQLFYKGILQTEKTITRNSVINFKLTRLIEVPANPGSNNIRAWINTGVTAITLETDNNLSKNYFDAIKYYDMIEKEFADNYDNIKLGKRNSVVLEKFKITFDPVIKEINKINREIASSGTTNELSDRKSMNVELLNSGLESMINIVAGNDKELSKNSSVYKFLSEEFSKTYKKFSEDDKEKISVVFSSKAIENSDKVNLSEVLMRYSRP
ncbi:MAG: hypothetical protein KAQ90_05515, partial [Melioribacteraceae bacterium]|nr:hypothetical protein [Melioribacteraceae bacterium]